MTECIGPSQRVKLVVTQHPPLQRSGSSFNNRFLCALLVVLFHMAFSFTAMRFLVSFSRDTRHNDLPVFISVPANCLFWKRKYIIPFLANILLLPLIVHTGTPEVANPSIYIYI